MAGNSTLISEKLDQAVAILREQDVDCWMTFVRETSLAPDPSLGLILDMDMVWQSAFLITRDNQRIAIVGKHDAQNIEETGAYTQVIPYVQGIRDDLVTTLRTLNPARVAVNYSLNDVAADGLGHGLMMLLQQHLAGTGFIERLISAEKIVGALRGRKSPSEITRIRTAIATTETIYQSVTATIKPGDSETEIAARFHRHVMEQRLGTSWDWQYCPTVNAGPDSPVGHVAPMERYKVGPGMLIHMDFGVKQDEYCADLQRVVYVRRPGEKEAPPEVRQGFEAARQALLAGVEALKPGAQGWQVDAAARAKLVDLGYPEYQHAFGHHLGRSAHDGATVLGPRWERYGDTPHGVIEVGNVFAVELGFELPGYGYIACEENVLVGEDGAEWLSTPQEEVWLR